MSSPELAVIIPLEDPRGDVVKHLRTWTRSQTLPRERFQVILGADGRHPEFERQVASELAPQDEIVVAPGAPLMGLYDAGASAAQAPVLLFTEAHVRAEPECLAVVAQAFAVDSDLDAATLTHVQSPSDGISPLSERWFARSFDEWDRAGWIRLNTTAVALRGETYTRVGGLDERLGLYAPSLMSAHLADQGARIKHLEDAVITHELETEMAFALELGADFARGECIVRREQSPEFCERYFGPPGLWERRYAYSGEVARPVVDALRSAISNHPRDRRWLSRELAARMPARLAGARPRLAWERTTARLHQTMAAAWVIPFETRWRSYVSAQHRTVRATQLEEIAGERWLPPADSSAGAIGASDLDGVLIGTQGLEEGSDRSFRWTEPVALLRVSSPANSAVLRLETGGLRGDPSGYLLGVYAGSMQIPRDLIASNGEAVEVRLSPRFASAAADSGLVIISRPLVPSRNGSSDRRRLGMPVVELELSPA